MYFLCRTFSFWVWYYEYKGKDHSITEKNDSQGSNTILPISKLRIDLSHNDTNNPHLKYGISPSLLPMDFNCDFTLEPGKILDLKKRRIPSFISTSSCLKVGPIAESSTVYISYQQHRHAVMSLLDKELASDEVGK